MQNYIIGCLGLFSILLLIPISLSIADATRDDKPPGISMLFCGHNKNKKTLEECDDTIDGYSWGSKINILIFAPAWNEDKYKIDTIGDDSTYPIGAYSETSRHGGPCKLVETEVNSGLFYGRLKLNGFPHDAHGAGVKYLWGSKTCDSGKGADNESIKIGAGGGSSGGAFTVFWEYDKDKSLTKTGYYSWREGVIEFDKNYYELDDKATVTLHDIDLEVFPYDMNTIRMRVWSDTDPSGITLTSSYQNGAWAGISADFGFTTNEKSRNDYELRISPGDKIYAQYTDRTLPRPYSNDDHKEIFATSYINSDLGKPISYEKIEITKSISLDDSHERTEILSTFLELKNSYESNLEAYVIFQIKDESGRVIHIDWARTFAPNNGNFMVNHYCDVIESGEYELEIFVLNNLENPVSYAPKFVETIII
tara:strand:- start:145 stop:1413 length:1269 start_codon:yes stop_codon:yes gene_type:complete